MLGIGIYRLMKKITFIHISDVLLGALPDRECVWSGERKNEIYMTFEAVVARAGELDVDFLLVAGNLFDHQPSEEELVWLDEIFGSLKHTVVIYAAGFQDNLGSDAPLLDYGFKSRVCVIGSPGIRQIGDKQTGDMGYTAVRDEQATMALDHIHFPDKDVDIYGVSYFDRKMDARVVDDAEPQDEAVCNVLIACGGDRRRMPVDWNNGGMEHTTLHLLYSRFWHKFLYDQGVVPCPEPYQKRTSHGMILGENGEKMSKSRGNVVNPDDIVREYGADTLRTYEMFIGAFDLSASWSEDGVKGCRRFLERIWKLQDIMTDEEEYSSDLETKMHQTIKKVSSDYENLKYNTAIAAMMALLNDFTKKGSITKGEYKTLLILLNPVAPHITEELWQIIGGSGYVYEQTWPEYEEAKTVENTVEIAVQINGKTKGTLAIGRDDAKEDVIAKAKESIADKLTGNIVKEIYVPGRIVNIVMK